MNGLWKTLSALAESTGSAAISGARKVKIPSDPKVFGSLAVACYLLYGQVKTGDIQTALTTLAGILAILGIGGAVQQNAEHLENIRNNPNMPGTPVPAPDTTQTL